MMPVGKLMALKCFYQMYFLGGGFLPNFRWPDSAHNKKWTQGSTVL